MNPRNHYAYVKLYKYLIGMILKKNFNKWHKIKTLPAINISHLFSRIITFVSYPYLLSGRK